MTAEQAVETWDLPFSRGEYSDRLKRVREVMADRRIDLLYVTHPANLNYLLGHDSVRWDGRNPTGLAIPLDSVSPLLFDTYDDESLRTPVTEAAVYVTYGTFEHQSPNALDVVVDELKSRGWLRGRLGLERWSWAPAAPTLNGLAARAAASVEEIVDGSFLVDHVRLVKSPKELEYIREALRIADRAMEVVRDSVAPGMMETEIMGLLYYEVGKMGGDEPGLRMMIHGGPRSSQFLSPASRRRLQKGDILTVEMCASYNKYHGSEARSFSLGENAFWAHVLEKAGKSIPKVVSRIAPGTPLADVQTVMDEHIDSVGLREYVWWIGGYALGVAVPPDWVGHVYLNPTEGFETFDFVPGYVTNYEHLFQDKKSRVGCGFIDTLIMTEGGIEIPSQFSRTLTVV